MKFLITFFVLPFFILSCGSGGGNKMKDPVDITKNPDYQKGLTLVANNKCLTCHSINETVTGPPYSEIAKKYASMPDTIVSHLAGKIISGGAGVWGQIFMTPHPDLSKEDAETMVRYILLLGKQ